MEGAKDSSSGGNVIVAGYDGTTRGQDAVALATLIAETLDGDIVAVHVRGDKDPPLPEAGGRSQLVVIPGESPSEGLAGFAATGARMITLGSSHRAGVGRIFPGGVAERLFPFASCPVAIAPVGYADRLVPGGVDRFRVIEVGFDGSPESEAALRLAAEIAADASASLRVVAVGGPPTVTPAATQPGASFGAVAPPIDLQALLHETVRSLRDELRALPVFERGDPARLLLERAEEGVDLLVMGTRGRGPLRGAVLGSTAATVMRHASCPVVAMPRSAMGLLRDSGLTT